MTLSQDIKPEGESRPESTQALTLLQIRYVHYQIVDQECRIGLLVETDNMSNRATCR